MANYVFYSNIKGYKEYLNISAAVGRGGVNYSPDVFIVQAMLNEFSEFYLHSYYRHPNGCCDSIMDQQLERLKKYINKFAKKHHTNDKSYLIGCVDPIQGSIYAFGTTNTWTLVKLNDFVRNIAAHRGTSKETIGSQNHIEYLSKKYSLGIIPELNIHVPAKDLIDFRNPDNKPEPNDMFL